MWQWFRFLVARVPPDKKLLLLNLDETSIRFWYQPRLGLRGRARATPAGRGAARQASRGQLRKAFTHVAVICDDAALQPQLPQVILVNERTCTNLTLQNWKPIPGCKAEVLRHKSAWINNAKFADILRRIGEALKTHAPDRQAILLMDAHSCHFSEEALAALHAYDIWPCIIPASTTSCLQPLDTHVFARFKMFLRTRLHQAMLSGANKDLDVEEVLDALMHAMRGVLQRNKWSGVFYQKWLRAPVWGHTTSVGYIGVDIVTCHPCRAAMSCTVPKLLPQRQVHPLHVLALRTPSTARAGRETSSRHGGGSCRH